MDERPEVYNLESIEQLRALADELRIRIVDTLAQQAMTVTQLGEVLGVAVAKVHYHARELERVGLVKLVFTREKSGILEKYYMTVAKKLHVPQSILQHAPADEVLAAVNEYVQTATAAFMRASNELLHAKREALEDRSIILSVGGSSLWLTPSEHDQFAEQLQALIDQYATRRGIEGEREVIYFEMAYDAQLAGEAPEPSAPRAAPMPSGPVPPKAPKAPTPPSVPPGVPSIVETRKGGRVMAAGAVTFSRKDLERVVARGERLDIKALGYCTFDDDIPPELAERAIARFRYRGILSASPAVREVLKRKEAGE